MSNLKKKAQLSTQYICQGNFMPKSIHVSARLPVVIYVRRQFSNYFSQLINLFLYYMNNNKLPYIYRLHVFLFDE